MALWRRMIFHRMLCWTDPLARPGPEAMAVDEWLLGQAHGAPVLRVYRWDGPWCSVGYFTPIAEATVRLDCPSWVRRLTGGGVVDHRADWTYSLVIPRDEPAANWRGATSYREIHHALALALADEGVACALTPGATTADGPLCFTNPVDHDLIDGDGRKIAGAGQRRTRHGLLHQGSVALPAGDAGRALRLARRLADIVETREIVPDVAAVASLVAQRYGAPEWTARR